MHQIGDALEPRRKKPIPRKAGMSGQPACFFAYLQSRFGIE
jgi:hypothetical protein